MVTGTGLHRSEVICASVHSSLHAALSVPSSQLQYRFWARFPGHALKAVSSFFSHLPSLAVILSVHVCFWLPPFKWKLCRATCTYVFTVVAPVSSVVFGTRYVLIEWMTKKLIVESQIDVHSYPYWWTIKSIPIKVMSRMRMSGMVIWCKCVFWFSFPFLARAAKTVGFLKVKSNGSIFC